MNALQLDAARLSDDGKSLEILDQTLLPGTVKTLRLTRIEDVWEAIRTLRVRGAPAIGVAAAIGLAVSLSRFRTEEPAAFLAELHRQKDYLSTARPTAVNLFWALERMEAAAREDPDLSVPALRARLFTEAERIREEDIAISRAIGEAGFALLHPGCGVLTHCNAGTLATAKYGTALAPLYIALERGMTDFRVYCDETRPLLQGARLTAFEMRAAGADTTLLCDNMAASLMQSGKIDLVLVGCDRVAANGDTANKIGTCGVAILAKHYGIPFYVCAPSTTIDMSLESGRQIPIEERGADEVTELWYKRRMAPPDIRVYNPAFDVTEAELITGIITEKGLVRPPYGPAFRALGF